MEKSRVALNPKNSQDNLDLLSIHFPEACDTSLWLNLQSDLFGHKFLYTFYSLLLWSLLEYIF